MARKLNPWVHIKIIFTFVPGISLFYYGWNIFFNGGILKSLFNLLKYISDNYGWFDDSLNYKANLYFSMRVLPQENIFGILLVFFSIILILYGIYLILPEKYIKTIDSNKNISKLFYENLFNSKLFYFAGLSIILLLSLVILFEQFNAPISRIHSFKQSEVASNIQFYLDEGLKIEEQLFNKNQELKLFSYPFYQYIVYGVAKTTSMDVVQSGRAINIILFLMTFILFVKIMEILKANKFIILNTMLVFSSSVLVLYYFRSVHPDPLAIFLSYLSLFYLIKYEKNQKRKILFFIIAICTGIIAALIKSPIYLMVVIAFLFIRFNKEKLKGLFTRDMVIYLVIIGLSVIFYKISSDYINEGVALKDTWIFGTIEQRLSLTPYLLLFIWFAFEVTNPILIILFLAGIYISIKMLKENNFDIDKVFLGLLIGMFITILIFFNVFQGHDYYHLPFIIIVAYFVSLSFQKLIEKVQKKYQPKLSYLFLWGLFISIVLMGSAFLRIPIKADDNVIEGGKFIQKVTNKNAFVFYSMGESYQDWDPTYLFSAKRNGFNINSINLKNSAYMDSIVYKFTGKFSINYLYVPSEIYNLDSNFYSDYKLFKESNVGKIFILP